MCNDMYLVIPYWSIPTDAAKLGDARETNKKNYIGLESDFSYIDSLKEAIDERRPFSKGLPNSLHSAWY